MVLVVVGGAAAYAGRGALWSGVLTRIPLQVPGGPGDLASKVVTTLFGAISNYMHGIV